MTEPPSPPHPPPPHPLPKDMRQPGQQNLSKRDKKGGQRSVHSVTHTRGKSSLGRQAERRRGLRGECNQIRLQAASASWTTLPAAGAGELARQQHQCTLPAPCHGKTGQLPTPFDALSVVSGPKNQTTPRKPFFSVSAACSCSVQRPSAVQCWRERIACTSVSTHFRTRRWTAFATALFSMLLVLLYNYMSWAVRFAVPRCVCEQRITDYTCPNPPQW